MINHNEFIDAIQEKLKVEIIFFSKEDRQNLTRICAPLDYGPMRRNNQIINQGRTKYHVWDFNSDEKPHPLALAPEQILGLKVLDEKFDPATIDPIILKYPFFIPRDWN